MSHEPDCTNSLSYKIIEMSCKKNKNKTSKEKIEKMKIRMTHFFKSRAWQMTHSLMTHS